MAPPCQADGNRPGLPAVLGQRDRLPPTEPTLPGASSTVVRQLPISAGVPLRCIQATPLVASENHPGRIGPFQKACKLVLSRCSSWALYLTTALHVQLRRTIRVALCSGEEEGLKGSRGYVKEHFGSYPVSTATGRMTQYLQHRYSGILRHIDAANTPAAVIHIEIAGNQLLFPFLISVFAILSWRIFWMTMLNRAAPNASPSWPLPFSSYGSWIS